MAFARTRAMSLALLCLMPCLATAVVQKRRVKQPAVVKIALNDDNNDDDSNDDLYTEPYIEQRDLAADPRFFFANFTSSLITVNTTLLAYGLIALGLLVAAALAIYYLWVEATSRSGSAGGSYGSYGSGGGQYAAAAAAGGYGQGYGYQQYARSAGEDSVFSAMNVLKWISMMQELYEKFDYTDLECQKRLICDVMQEPEYFGSVASRMKTGFQLAKYLEALNMPDDIRELLDEYTDASERSAGSKECHEYFSCPYSLKDAVRRNFANSL